MKKVFVIMMCCLGLAFASCKPEQVAPNAAFVGSYVGSIYLVGTATAPELANMGYPAEIPLDSMQFIVNADITAGETKETVLVKFSIDEDTYEHTSTVNGKQMSFGTITYHYTVQGNDFTVDLVLDGILSDDANRIALSGPFTGNGKVIISGIPIPISLQVAGDVTGTINRK